MRRERVAPIRVNALSPSFGVEIEGLDLRQTLDDDSVTVLREQFDTHGLILVRSPGLEADDQAYLTGLVVDRTRRERQDVIATTHTYANYVTNQDQEGYAPFGELLFHCDMMWGEKPMEVISLYGMAIERPAVPTRFINMARALEMLPEDLRERISHLQAVHESGQQRRGDHKEQLVEVQHDSVRSTTKPVILTHPRTGVPLLYVSQQMTARIDGMDPETSEALLEELFAHLYREECVVEHDWREGDLVVWDNLAVQHARGNVEFEGPVRTLRKVIAPKLDLSIAKPKMVKATT